jgi:altronate dehydratase small subunit
VAAKLPIDERLLLLWPEDNVLVAKTAFAAGAIVKIDDIEVALQQPLALGHKIARIDMAPGVLVMKYGSPIGVTTQSICRGEHVHVHNVQSRYTRTHLIEATS